MTGGACAQCAISVWSDKLTISNSAHGRESLSIASRFLG
jgi:hypothetical protein